MESDSTICFSDECSASKRLFSVSTLRFDRDNAADQVARGRRGVVYLILVLVMGLFG